MNRTVMIAIRGALAFAALAFCADLGFAQPISQIGSFNFQSDGNGNGNGNVGSFQSPTGNSNGSIGSPTMTWILLVTWIIPGKPATANSYQTQFSSQQTCEAARVQVINSAEQMRQQRISSAGNNQDLQIVMTMGAPQVSAVCSQQ